VIFVCADGDVFVFTDADSALAAARLLAARHARVAIDDDETHARCIWCRALPGMVVCRRGHALEGVDSYPLTATTALVRA
jgi:hypothetical protein